MSGLKWLIRMTQNIAQKFCVSTKFVIMIQYILKMVD